MIRLFFTLFFLLNIISSVSAQNEKAHIKSMFNEALTNQTAYNNLRYLCKNCKGRVTGSPEAAAAVEYTYQLMKNMNLDTVFKQPVQVPHWVRGEAETASIQSIKFGFKELPVTALGMSVGTEKEGLSARVVEVHNFDELAKLGKEKITGKSKQLKCKNKAAIPNDNPKSPIRLIINAFIADLLA